MSEEIKNDVVPEIDYESEARKQNWVPKEEFRGNAEDWVDAKEFVERGRQINPILRANNDRLMKELDKTKKQMEELRSTAEEFKKFQKEQFERKSAALEKEIAELRDEKRRAISAGDGDKVVEIDDKIDSLKEEKAQAKADSQKTEEVKPDTTTQPVDPVLEAWVEKNSWYAKDNSMASVANMEAERLHSLYPNLKGQAFLDELDKVLDQTFTAEKLGRTTKTKPRSPVEGASNNGIRTTGKNDKSYENLPPEAKAACDRFVKQKLMTREQYVADYSWD